MNLMEKCFESVKGAQVKFFKLSGKSVRMDSKLIGTNIAQYSRYELIHRTLCKVLSNPVVLGMLSPRMRKDSEGYLGSDVGKIVYRADQGVMAQRLFAIGTYIYQVLKRLKDDAPLYSLLCFTGYFTNSMSWKRARCHFVIKRQFPRTVYRVPMTRMPRSATRTVGKHTGTSPTSRKRSKKISPASSPPCKPSPRPFPTVIFCLMLWIILNVSPMKR